MRSPRSSERGGNGLLLLRVASLFVAALVWFLVTWEYRGERPVERVVEASVTYNSPQGMVILNTVERVRVRLRGAEREIRHVNPYLIDVQVEIESTSPGTTEIPLRPENVLTPESIEVVSIEPPFLRIELDQETKRLVTVRANLTGEPAAGAQVVGRPRARPAQVLVSGPASLLTNLQYLETSPITLDGHALDFEESTLVLSPNPLVKILNSQVVTVQIAMRQPEVTESGR